MYSAVLTRKRKCCRLKSGVLFIWSTSLPGVATTMSARLRPLLQWRKNAESSQTFVVHTLLQVHYSVPQPLKSLFNQTHQTSLLYMTYTASKGNVIIFLFMNLKKYTSWQWCSIRTFINLLFWITHLYPNQHSALQQAAIVILLYGTYSPQERLAQLQRTSGQSPWPPSNQSLRHSTRKLYTPVTGWEEFKCVIRADWKYSSGLSIWAGSSSM